MEAPADPSVLVRSAATHGLTRDILRGPSWQWLSRGLCGPTGWAPAGWDRWAAIRKVLPEDGAAGHLTGASLRGWWLPTLPLDVPLFATTATTTHVQRPGVYVRRSPRTPTKIVNGTRVVTAAATVHELARDLSVLDLVPVIESAAIVSGCPPGEVLATAPTRLRGIVKLRAAVPLADPRTES